MRYCYKILVLFFLSTSISFSQGNESEFKEKKIIKTLNNCNTDSLNCTYVKVDYVEMVSGKQNKKINKFINDLLIQYASGYSDSVYNSVDDAVNNFIRDFSEFEFVDSTYTPHPWYNEVSVMQEKSLNSIICLTASQGIYTGGAHPSSYQFTYNISAETGDTIRLTDIFVKGFDKTLDKMLDKKFRKLNNIAPDVDLQNEGLFVSKIEHNNNFAILKEGIRFIYNQYEIAPYVAGTTEIILTYQDLSSIIKEDGILTP